MNKKTTGIIVAVVAVLAIVGIVIALNMNKNSDGDTNQPNQSSNTSKASNVDPAKEFAPQPLDSLAYVATAKTTVGGQTVETVTESDGKGTFKVSSTTQGTKSESYVSGSTVISCVNDECTKSTVDADSQEAASLAPSVAEYKDSATYSGSEACPAGTCQVWKATGSLGEVTYYIDDQNRISKVVMGQAETVYEYKNVSITVPAV